MREADRALKYTYAPSAGTSSAAKRELRPAIAIKRKASNVYTLEQEEKQECPACSEAHVLTQCPKYKALSVEQRWNLIKEKKLCFKCANSTHRRITCKAKLCGVEQCRRPHHSSLHQAEKKPENTEVRDKEQVLSVTPKTNVGARTVLLKMCPVVVAGPRGEVRTHALLDEGATVTLMDEDLAEKIGADGPTQALHLSGVNMAQKEKSQQVGDVLMKLKHLRDLPEELCYERARPGILLGADHWEHIVSRELRVGGRNEPAASRTLLGWVVHDHFKIEALGVTPEPRVSDADRRAIATLKTSIRKIDCGYEVGLPWRQDNTAMPPSYNAALRRLRQIEHKMDASPEFAREYTAQVNNLIEKGYAVRCDGSESSSPVCWYLPHFAVQNPNKPGKQRLVFDAAATSHGVSLNDHLLEGPDMLMSLPGIMFRFRESAVAVTADIQEMFLRIKIRAEDQSAQQFLWRGNDRTNPPQRFKMTSMIFGAASSPFMAHFVRNHNANVHAQLYPRAAEAITKYHYMDDLVASYDTPGEAHEAIEEMKTVHAAAGFTLRGWNSNDECASRRAPELRSNQPTQLGRTSTQQDIGTAVGPGARRAGIQHSNEPSPERSKTQVRTPTKREALSTVMSIYDPLGLLSVYTIRAKIILQNLWRLKMSWDERVPEEDGKLFATWLSQLSAIGQLRIPRHYGPTSHERRIELHVMCDASEQAYAAVAYWRMVGQENVTLSLVAAKAKVAPRRTQTIPRLELQAAVIRARLADAVKKEHRIVAERTIYWTDSTTVIHWIRNDERRYTPFVAHRLREIAELTDKSEWRWLPTTHNVADEATRLRATPDGSQDDEAEVLHITESPEKERWLPDPTRFSKYETLVRATARVLAFADIARRKTPHLEVGHLKRAELLLMQQAQRESFGEELQRLKSSQPVQRTSRLFKLDPVLEDGVLRVRGRIGAATVPDDAKRPVILDGRHPVTKLIVLQEHCAADATHEAAATGHGRSTPCPLGPVSSALLQLRSGLLRADDSEDRTPAREALGRAVHLSNDTRHTSGARRIPVNGFGHHGVAQDGSKKRMAENNVFRQRHKLQGADEELRAAYKEWQPELRNVGLLHRMEWRFIPPGAPNQGGAWERLVRSVKTALTVTLKEKAPSEETLRTLLAEAEHSVNSRPLTHVSVDPRDPEALTPNHFYVDRRAWRAAQALADNFWRRWIAEYLPTLVPRGESTRRVRPLRVNDVVAIADQQLPRNVWPLGIVQRTFEDPTEPYESLKSRQRAAYFDAR
ncbi:uncharacterized protein LOC119193309 [Manduca sexta]|uniref:uncharacterized protein LOC119193309 n=1 Tax=Manduca sexta TaxID=7130 RepID=UPI0018900220|nr:uncharacterized protein LOC119193309 [Manduca sexta]